MKTFHKQSRTRAFSFFELLIVIAVVLVLAALLLPALSSRGTHPRIQCLNNLKHVALASLIWAGDHGDKLPTQVSITNGGTMEYVGGPETFRHFQVLSNELTYPKILFCPAESDPFRAVATTFVPPSPAGSPTGHFSRNANLSYFVGLDVTAMTNASMFLAGDHNLTNGPVVTSGGILELSTNRPSGWTYEMHSLNGQVAFADGHVERLSISKLGAAITRFEVTNRLAMP